MSYTWKRTIAMLLFAVGILLFYAAAAHAGLFSSLATSNWETRSTEKYKLDMHGFDARVYEFDTKNGMKCVAVYSGGEQAGFQMECIGK